MLTPKRIIIAGSRSFKDFDRLEAVAKEVIKELVDKDKNISITIISGQAKGADILGERFALKNNYNVLAYPADWNKFGLIAGFLRNKKMAEESDMLIAFWNGRSKGTKNMIANAMKRKLKIKLCFFDLREE